jgi:uncharacterized membrane protein
MTKRALLLLLSLIGGLGLVYLLYVVRGHETLPDFVVFNTAGVRFISGDPLYQAADGHYQFKYLPASAICFVPYAILPLGLAKYAWMVTITAALIGIVTVSRRLMIFSHDSWKVLVLPTVLIMAKYYLRELDLGQANAVMVCLLVAGSMMLIRGRPLAAGLLIGLAALLKPYALVFLPYLMIRREWRSFAAAALVIAGAILLPTVRYGLTGNIDLLRGWLNLMTGSTPSLLTNPDNISLFGFYAKWIGVEQLSVVMLFAALSIAVIGLIFVYAVQSSRGHSSDDTQISNADRLIEVASLLLLIPLLSPQGWDNGFLAATMAIMMLIAFRTKFSRPYRWFLLVNFAVIGLSLYDLMGRKLYRTFMDTSVLTVCFLILFSYLIALRLRLPATARERS